MSPPITILIASLAFLAGYFIWRRLRNRQPDGWFLGPIVNGKNSSRGKVILTNNGWYISIDEPHYCTKKADAPLTGKTLTFRYRFLGDVRPVERPSEQPTFSAHFQRKGDNWTGLGKYAGFRWYSRQSFPLVPGDAEIVIPLERTFWIPVMADGEGFDEACAKVDRVGLVFGHDWGGRGHGVTGNGKFEVLSWRIE